MDGRSESVNAKSAAKDISIWDQMVAYDAKLYQLEK